MSGNSESMMAEQEVRVGRKAKSTSRRNGYVRQEFGFKQPSNCFGQGEGNIVRCPGTCFRQQHGRQLNGAVVEAGRLDRGR